MKKEITLPIEIMEKLANILFQDMNFHNPHKIVVEARSLLLELGITLKEKISSMKKESKLIKSDK